MPWCQCILKGCNLFHIRKLGPPPRKIKVNWLICSSNPVTFLLEEAFLGLWKYECELELVIFRGLCLGVTDTFHDNFGSSWLGRNNQVRGARTPKLCILVNLHTSILAYLQMRESEHCYKTCFYLQEPKYKWDQQEPNCTEWAWFAFGSSRGKHG